MVTHIALFRWKKEVPQEEIDRVMQSIRDLKRSVPNLIDLQCGENFSKWNEGYTHAVVVTVKNKEVLDAYRKHPAHVPVGKRVEELEEHSIGIDFES